MMNAVRWIQSRSILLAMMNARNVATDTTGPVLRLAFSSRSSDLGFGRAHYAGPDYWSLNGRNILRPAC